MLALDVARIEAGLLLIDVDYSSSRKAVIDAQATSPFELGLGRLVDLGKPSFVGKDALVAERMRGPDRALVGLELDWPSVEAVYDRAGLPPAVSPIASRVPVPVYAYARQIGKATSTTWSPTLKKLIALALLRREHGEIGTKVEMELTVEAVRHRVTATVVKTPFFSPARKTRAPAQS
jgi:aminomethyltransferase